MFRGVNYEKKSSTQPHALRNSDQGRQTPYDNVYITATATERRNILPFAWRSELVNYV